MTDETQHKLKFRYVHGYESKSKLTGNTFQTFFSHELPTTLPASVYQNQERMIIKTLENIWGPKSIFQVSLVANRTCVSVDIGTGF